MPEPFQVQKALDVSPAALGKSTSSVFKGLLVLGLAAIFGFSLWVSLIQPHTKWAVKTQAQSITIAPGAVAAGGKLTIEAPKTEAIKRHLILFTEPYVGVATGGKSEIGIRGGCRWEF